MYTNNTNIPLSLAAWLATDFYNYDARPNVISATSLLAPVRALILAQRYAAELAEIPTDLTELVASRIGTAGHDQIERIWTDETLRTNALTRLGYPKKVISAIKVNPEPEELTDDIIPVYLELRSEKAVGNWIVSGQLDFLAEGQLRDFKFTSAYVVMSGLKNDDWAMQGSIYRWLNPDKVSEDTIAMDLVVRDWNAMRSKAEAAKGYPAAQTVERTLPLKSVQETERYIQDKLRTVDRYQNTPDEQLPLCSEQELKRSQTVWKYFSKPTNKTASKNFTDQLQAQQHLADKKFVGEIRVFPGKPSACRFCNAQPVCTQYRDMVARGEFN